MSCFWRKRLAVGASCQPAPRGLKEQRKGLSQPLPPPRINTGHSRGENHAVHNRNTITIPLYTHNPRTDQGNGVSPFIVINQWCPGLRNSRQGSSQHLIRFVLYIHRFTASPCVSLVVLCKWWVFNLLSKDCLHQDSLIFQGAMKIICDD